MPGNVSFLLVITTFVMLASACSAQPIQTTAPTFTPTSVKLPASESEVPRVTVTDAKTALDSGEAILLDVRSPAAFEVSHIPGAVSIPLAEVEANPGGLSLDKDQWIIAYCTWLNEHTSARAAFVLSQNGYTRATALLGGFQAWIEAGFSMEQ